MNKNQLLFAGIAVSDYEKARAWYTRFFGREPDVIVTENEESMWQVAEGGWIYIIADPAQAGKALLMLMVDDLAQTLAELKKRGLTPTALETEPGHSKAVFTDPDGNMPSLGQVFTAND